MLRNSVQFHWHNQGFENFEQFLAALTMKRRKNIRRERDQVARESITFRHIPGSYSTAADWEFFYRCYENTYLEHRSHPYLNETFFKLWVRRMPENLHLIVAERAGNRIAASLLVIDHKTAKAYGRYWGAIEHIPCLHFETAYIRELNTAFHTRYRPLKVAHKVSTRWRAASYPPRFNQRISLLIHALLKPYNTS